MGLLSDVHIQLTMLLVHNMEAVFRIEPSVAADTRDSGFILDPPTAAGSYCSRWCESVNRRCDRNSGLNCHSLAHRSPYRNFG
jgi:hypothetical protein